MLDELGSDEYLRMSDRVQESALESLRQSFDERLRSLRTPDASDCLRMLINEPTRLGGTVYPGQSHFAPQPSYGAERTMIDIAALTIVELQALIGDAKARIADLDRTQRADLRYRLESQARAAGFDISDLFSKLRSKPDATKTPSAKYQNPGNPSESWGGRGKRPAWLRDALAAGKSLVDFEAR